MNTTRILADRIAADHGDTPETTAARRAALVADLDQWQDERGTPYRPGGRTRASETDERADTRDGGAA